MTSRPRKRVLIVDDSPIVRKVLSEALSNEPDIEVAGTAPDAFIAREKIMKLQPDVLTLDIEMPRMNGLAFLKELMQSHPMPVIVVSSQGKSSCDAAIEAMRIGAVDVLPKPGGPYSVADLRAQLVQHIRAAVGARVKPFAPRERSIAKARLGTAVASTSAIIAIGASTGGTEAIADIMARLPKNTPGTLIVQHIPAVFSESFAKRLNRTCAMEVREAKHLDEVKPGVALVAPGSFHMMLAKSGGKRIVVLSEDPPVHYHRPSVDVLFRSVAEVAGSDAIGILLTGMGSDGARGLLSLRKAGAETIVQDEASSIVFGMPGEAIRLGAADRGTPLAHIPMMVARALETPRTLT
jgi:two-component system chemotaxis response regulator CheB